MGGSLNRPVKKFNGTSDFFATDLDLSAETSVWFSFWLWQNSFESDAQRTIFSLDDGDNTSLRLMATFDSPNDFLVNRGGQFDAFAKPSARIWHPYVMYIPTDADPDIWVDTVVQGLTRNDGSPSGNYGDGTAYLMKESGGNYNAGMLGLFAIWSGSETLTDDEIADLARGLIPSDVHPAGILFEKVSW